MRQMPPGAFLPLALDFVTQIPSKTTLDNPAAPWVLIYNLPRNKRRPHIVLRTHMRQMPPGAFLPPCSVRVLRNYLKGIQFSVYPITSS